MHCTLCAVYTVCSAHCALCRAGVKLWCQERFILSLHIKRIVYEGFNVAFLLWLCPMEAWQRMTRGKGFNQQRPVMTESSLWGSSWTPYSHFHWPPPEWTFSDQPSALVFLSSRGGFFLSGATTWRGGSPQVSKRDSNSRLFSSSTRCWSCPTSPTSSLSAGGTSPSTPSFPQCESGTNFDQLNLMCFWTAVFMLKKLPKKKHSIFSVGAGNHKMPFSTWLFYSSLPTHRGICICCLNMAEGSCLHLLHLASHSKRSALLQLLLLLPASNCLTRSELLCSCCCCGATPENYHQSSSLGRRNRRQPLAPKNFLGGNFC